MPKVKKYTQCSFCGASRAEVGLLLEGLNGCICESCVNNAYEILENASKTPHMKGNSVSSKFSMSDVPKPAEIKQFLDQYIIGQDEAKKTIAVSVYNHYKRICNINGESTDDVELEKSNIVMVGPTGTGKTLIARSIARLLNVPFTIVDATVFTQAGYVGEDVESILSRLLQAADYDVQKAERGIVFIDEIDKVARKQDNPSITRDVGGEGVMQAMLKLLEGTIVNVPPQGGRKHPDQKYIQVDTKNILYICGGAFENIEDKIAHRLNTHVVGFDSVKNVQQINRENLMSYIQPQDLRAFGLLPELIGRLPVITSLNPLNKEALRKILLEPKNSIVKQYTRLLEMDGVKLTFEADAIDYIVDSAYEYKLGARGLRGIVESIMKEAMFNAPSSKKKQFVVTRKFAESQMKHKNL